VHTLSDLKATVPDDTSFASTSRTSTTPATGCPGRRRVCTGGTTVLSVSLTAIRRNLARALLSVALSLPTFAYAGLNVFACESEWAALAKELGGDKVDVYTATTAKQDPHYVQARPSLIAKMRQAELLVCSGAELEIGWLPLLLRKAGNSRVMNEEGQFFAADYVDKLEVPERLDRSLGDVHAEGNPHVHTSPANILIIAEHLSERLALVDSDNTEYYQAAYRDFSERWRAAMQEWRERTAVLKGFKVITHHRFWSYLNEWLGIELVATLEPVPGVSPSSSYLAGLIKTVEQEDPAFIMRVDYVSERPASWLSERTGLPVVVLPASVNFHDGETSRDWFESLITSLEAAASKTEGDGSGG